MKKSNARDYFPKNYADSRQRFVSNVKNLTGSKETGQWKVESKTNSDLFVDHVWLPPTEKPETLLVLISGIHGSETYTGAAILNLFLEEHFPSVNRKSLGIFIVHAMNPFGFKHHKRCTESGINLNRNFSVSGELFKRNNVDSKRMNDFIISRKPVTSLESKIISTMRKQGGQIYFGDISLEELTKGIAPGQFETPENLEYGGKKTESQTQALINRMKELMPAYKEVIALDLHTGLGDRGRLHLLTDGAGKSLNSRLFSKIFKPEQDKAFYAFTPPETEGFYPVFGATNSMFGELAADHQDVCAVTLEFGTLGHSMDQQIDAFNRFVTEHEGHYYGYANTEIEKQVLQRNFERSYPDDDQWRSDVLKAGEGLIQGVLQRVGGWQ